MHKLTDCWEWLRRILAERPVQVLGYALAAVILTITLSVALVRSSNNQKDIRKIKQVLCNSPDKEVTKQQQLDCQHLLDRLIAHPTPAQVHRLKQIIENGK